MSQAMPPAAPAAIPQVPAAPALNPAVVKGAEGLEAAKAGLLKRLASRLPKSRGGRAALGTAAIAGSTAGYLGLKKMFSGKPGAQASAAPATAPAAAPSAGRKVGPHVEAPVTEHLPGAEPTDPWSMDALRHKGEAAWDKTKEVGGQALAKGKELGGQAIEQWDKLSPEMKAVAILSGVAVMGAGGVAVYKGMQKKKAPAKRKPAPKKREE